MGFGAGLALKSLQWILRAIEFCCAAIVLGIFSYFLATLHDHDLDIANYIRAVEGISGAACLYLILGLLLLFCLGGIAFFSFVAIVLDLAFVGAFIYVAFENRHGANSCDGNVVTPFGSGAAGSEGDDGTGGVIHLPTLRTACRLETAAFAVSIVAIFFFLISAVVEFALARHHQREKAFGPSPANNYTQGYARRMRFPWQKKNHRDQLAVPQNPDALPLHQTPADMTTQRVSLPEETATFDAHTESPMKTYENGGATGLNGNEYHSQAPSAAPYPRDSVYDRYSTSSGYRIPPAGERAEMPAGVPVSQYAKNY